MTVYSDMLREEDKETILQEAIRLTAVDRQKDYGHPIDDFTCAATLINICLQRKYKEKWLSILSIDATDIPIIQICVKLAREMNKHKRDNLVDICGYARTLEMVMEKLG